MIHDITRLCHGFRLPKSRLSGVLEGDEEADGEVDGDAEPGSTERSEMLRGDLADIRDAESMVKTATVRGISQVGWTLERTVRHRRRIHLQKQVRNMMVTNEKSI